MRLALPLLSLLVFAAACTSDPRLADDCAANALCAARAGEPALILAVKDLAERRGDDLLLRPRTAPPITFTDHKAACDTDDADHCNAFAFMGAFAKPRALVVQQFFYEGSNFIFVDQDSGRQIKLGVGMGAHPRPDPCRRPVPAAPLSGQGAKLVGRPYHALSVHRRARKAPLAWYLGAQGE
jgi:hypothetical protein